MDGLRLFSISLSIAAGSCTESNVRRERQSGPFDGDAGMRTRGTADDAGAPHPACRPRLALGASISPVQLLASLTGPSCPSGWTALWHDRREEKHGEENWISLQPQWVELADTYGNARILGEALAETYSILGAAMPIIRIALFWPCVMEHPDVRQEFVDMVRVLQSVGYRVELVLLHHASYPTDLHRIKGQETILGGWAHPEAPEHFAAYTDLVLATFAPILPNGTVIYLTVEPVGQLMDGYLHRQGNYPPGGRDAGRSFATALVNLRNALQTQGPRIRAAGFVPAIGPNIRPVVGDTSAPGASLLHHLHNEWLLRALVDRCVDDDFDGNCERYVQEHAVDRIGITVYGVMHASADTTEFGLPGMPAQILARRDFRSGDFIAHPDRLRRIIALTYEPYRERIESGDLTFGIAEISFDHPDPDTQLDRLAEHLDVLEEFPAIAFWGYHSTVEHAEFTPREYHYELMDSCCPLRLTEWGRRYTEEITAWNCEEP